MFGDLAVPSLTTPNRPRVDYTRIIIFLFGNHVTDMTSKLRDLFPRYDVDKTQGDLETIVFDIT